MQNDRLRDFLKFFRSHLAWFILSAGFFAVILISAIFLSTKYVVDTAIDPSQVSTPTPSVQDLELAAKLETPTAPTAPAAVPTVKPLASVAPVATPAPSPKVISIDTDEPKSITTASSYTVKSGDSLWKIAESSYQDGSLYSRISHENNLKNPNKIAVGQTLIIPKITEQEKSLITSQNQKGQISDAAWSDDNTTYVDYTIVKGDSLWKIAETQLGDPYRWVELYQINKAIIGKNPDLIYPNVKIRVPSDTVVVKPTSSSPQSFNWTSSLLQ